MQRFTISTTNPAFKALIRTPVFASKAPVFASRSSISSRSVRTMAGFNLKEASPAEVKTMLESNSAIAYLDVRTPEEFESGPVTNAKNIPIKLNEAKKGAFMEAVLEAYSEKDAPIVVGCKLGIRSARAIGEMQAAGYTNLTNVQGGYDAWIEAGL